MSSATASSRSVRLGLRATPEQETLLRRAAEVAHKSLALHELATKVLPQYEADEGALTKEQLSQIKRSSPKAKGAQVRSSLVEVERT